MILSDDDIRWRLSPAGVIKQHQPKGMYHLVTQQQLVITPLEPSQIQPASVDLTLDTVGMKWSKGGFHKNKVYPEGFDEVSWRWAEISPGEFALGTTVERVEMPLDLVGQVDGKSTLGRLGLGVHITAGYIDPGFKGQITLEFVNHSRVPIKLTPGMKICQLVLHQMLSPASAPYGDAKFGSHYQNQKGVTKSHGLEDLR